MLPISFFHTTFRRASQLGIVATICLTLSKAQDKVCVCWKLSMFDAVIYYCTADAIPNVGIRHVSSAYYIISFLS